MGGGYVKMHLREIGREDVKWTELDQNKVQWQAFMNMVEENSFLSGWIIMKCTRRILSHGVF